MNPWRFSRVMFEAPVKSGPTSGPLTVSSHVTQLPQGMIPPEQFIWVPFRLVKERTTSPCRVTSTEVVPLPARLSYGVPGPKAGKGPLTSWLRTSMTLPFASEKAPIPS